MKLAEAGNPTTRGWNDSPEQRRFSPALFTDLYELTMAQAYFAEHMEQSAVFELSFRELPGKRNYMVASGLDDVLSYLSDLCFAPDDLGYLQSQGSFTPSFLSYLGSLKFTGEAYAVAEGTVVFPNEPLLQIVAPVVEAQILETFVLNQVHFQSLVAAKASRVVTVAKDRPIIDFGSRRAHGIDAALKVARATYLAGGYGTSNVLAGKLYNIPVLGTMAHSYVQAHDNESQAFEAFEKLYPETTLLVDTYDTLAAVRRVIQLSRKMGDRFRVRAIRLDSGDLAGLAIEARKLLDEARLQSVRIFASSGLDEYKIDKLVNDGTPIDGFGVGTNLAVSADAPALDMAYKLVEYGGKGRMKLSSGKVLYPGRKQVFREVEQGRFVRDVISSFDESLPGEPLLQPVFRGGRPVSRPTLRESRERLRSDRQNLPRQLLELEKAAIPYPVFFSERLQHDMATLRSEISLQNPVVVTPY